MNLVAKLASFFSPPDSLPTLLMLLLLVLSVFFTTYTKKRIWHLSPWSVHSIKRKSPHCVLRGLNFHKQTMYSRGKRTGFFKAGLFQEKQAMKVSFHWSQKMWVVKEDEATWGLERHCNFIFLFRSVSRYHVCPMPAVDLKITLHCQMEVSGETYCLINWTLLLCFSQSMLKKQG